MSNHSWSARLVRARSIILKCEQSMGRVLSPGERRDLLKDNTTWTSETIEQLVADIAAGVTA